MVHGSLIVRGGPSVIKGIREKSINLVATMLC